MSATTVGRTGGVVAAPAGDVVGDAELVPAGDVVGMGATCAGDVVGEEATPADDVVGSEATPAGDVVGSEATPAGDVVGAEATPAGVVTAAGATLGKNNAAEVPLTFCRTYPLRFGQCDPAGIAFFPRLVEMVSWVVEDWFGEALDDSFRDMHVARRHGIPAASISVDFVGPAQLGDAVAFSLVVEAIGRTSIRLRIDARADRGPVLGATLTVVYCDLSENKPRPIPVPEPLRSRITRFRVGGG